MLTECPSCLTVFRVTGAILKMGHGQVRCGKCRTQFDALDSLLDDDSLTDAAKATSQLAPAPLQDAAQESAQDPVIEAQEPTFGEEITMEGSRIEISGTYRVAADDAAQVGSADHFIHEHVVIDRDEQRPAEPYGDSDADQNQRRDLPDEEIIYIGTDDGEPVAEAAHHLLADAEPDQEPVPLSQRIWKRARHHQDSRTASTKQIVAELDALTQTPQSAAPRAGWWTAASVVLIVVLIAQAIHHYRDPLVRSPKWGGVVSRIYRALGLNLAPHWDLRTYKLLQWGLIPAGGKADELRLRASVTNGAAFTQPYPYIKMTMTDRWKEPVAERVFAPEEYLISTATANRMMAPRQRATAEIIVIDPGSDAVNYSIDACLQEGGRFVCSEDLPKIPPP